MATKKNTVQQKLQRAQAPFQITLLVVLLALSYFVLFEQYKVYQTKANTESFKQANALLMKQNTDLKGELEVKKKETAALSESYLTRLNARIPKNVEVARIVRYFDNLALKYGNPGQQFFVDSITTSDPKPSKDGAYDEVTVQLALRLSEYNLQRFIEEIESSYGTLEFLTSGKALPSDITFLTPLMRLNTLTATPQVVKNLDGTEEKFLNVAVSLTLFYQQYTQKEVEVLLQNITKRETELVKSKQLKVFAPQQMNTVRTLLTDAEKIAKQNTRSAIIKIRSADLILIELERKWEQENAKKKPIVPPTKTSTPSTTTEKKAESTTPSSLDESSAPLVEESAPSSVAPSTEDRSTPPSEVVAPTLPQ